MKWIYAALLIVCITLLLMHGAVRLEESFASGDMVVDIPAYLIALADYNTLYETTCRAAALDQRCGIYRDPAIAYKSLYMPPFMSTATAFSNAAAAWNGSGELPRLSANDFGSRIPLPETVNTQKEFVYNAASARNNTRFINNVAQNTVLTPLEVWLNNKVNVRIIGAGTLNQTYEPYLNVSGINYKFTKVFVKENDTERPIHTLYLADSTTGRRHGLGYTSSGDIRGIKGTVLENDDEALELLVRSANQTAFNVEFDRLTVVPVVASSSSVAPVVASSSSAFPLVGERASRTGAGEQLDLPELTYYEDAWYRNRMLFAKMYGVVPNPADDVRRYYQSAGVGAEGQSYELTALKFLELDRLILKSVTANGVVNVERLRGPAGAYNLEVPFPYDPAMYDIMNTMEEPSRSAQGLKCYTMTDVQGKIISYFSKRSYESLTATNLQLMAKFRANLCASYGYYSKDNLDSCACEGCCIPVSYKTAGGRRSGAAAGAAAAAAAAEAKKELGAGDSTGCIYTSRAYRLKKRQLPLGATEEDVCVKEGFATRTFTDEVGAAKATAGLVKGWRFFQQRMVPAYLDNGKEGFADDCLTPSLAPGGQSFVPPNQRLGGPSLPSPYRLRREKPKFMTCG